MIPAKRGRRRAMRDRGYRVCGFGVRWVGLLWLLWFWHGVGVSGSRYMNYVSHLCHVHEVASIYLISTPYMCAYLILKCLYEQKLITYKNAHAGLLKLSACPTLLNPVQDPIMSLSPLAETLLNPHMRAAPEKDWQPTIQGYPAVGGGLTAPVVRTSLHFWLA